MCVCVVGKAAGSADCCLGMNHLSALRLPLISVALLLMGGVASIPASPWGFEMTLFTGIGKKLALAGDEVFNYLQDPENGFPVTKTKKGLSYGFFDVDGQLQRTSLYLHETPPERLPMLLASAESEEETGKVLQSADGVFNGLPPGAQKFPPASAVDRIRRQMERWSEYEAGEAGSGMLRDLQSNSPKVTKGKRRNLVVLIRFKDHKYRKLPSRGDFQLLFNGYGRSRMAPSGTVRDFFRDQSYGLLDVESLVTPWIDLEVTQQEASGGNYGFCECIDRVFSEVMPTIDNMLDMKLFDVDRDGFVDFFVVVHSGYGAEWGSTDVDGAWYTNRIWSHMGHMLWPTGFTSKSGVRVQKYMISPAFWSFHGDEITHLGVIVHEMGHSIGLPDLYDYSLPGRGLGNWSTMASPWGWDKSQLYSQMDAWSRYKLGWSNGQELFMEGLQLLQPATRGPKVYKLSSGFPSGEYLLLEGRYPEGWDSQMPEAGILIYHIDERARLHDQGWPGQDGWPHNGKHYRVALLQADGRYDLEHGNNYGDLEDIYNSKRSLLRNEPIAVDDSTRPDLRRYQGGHVQTTGHRLSSFSRPGRTMLFKYETPAMVQGMPDVPVRSAPAGQSCHGMPLARGTVGEALLLGQNNRNAAVCAFEQEL